MGQPHGPHLLQIHEGLQPCRQCGCTEVGTPAAAPCVLHRAAAVFGRYVLWGRVTRWLAFRLLSVVVSLLPPPALPRSYPNLLVTAGLNDPRVGYWEPAKFVAKLRAAKTDDNLLLLKTDMGAGHFSVTGRWAGGGGARAVRSTVAAAATPPFANRFWQPQG